MNEKKSYGWKHQRKYTWKPDLPDHRNFKFEEFVKTKNLETQIRPSSINLTEWCPEVVDQENLGGCTACAMTGLVKFNLNYRKIPVDPLSRLFLYYNQRRYDDNIEWDDGDTLTDCVKMTKTYGICPEWEWPYDLTKWKDEPTPQCYIDALPNKISEYYSLEILDNMKTALANHYPFIFGFAVYESFESEEVKNTGIAPMPQKSEKLKGGHAVMCVGYKDDEQRFLVRNSWGKKWGMDGYFTMPYEYLTNRNLSDDFWVVI